MTEKMYSKEDLQNAHMAGQADAGVDPSYSNAQVYVAELDKPADTFREGEVIADSRFTRTYIKYHQGVADKDCYRHLYHSEQGQHVYDLVDAAEAIQPAVTSAVTNYKNWAALNDALDAYYAKAGK